MGLLSSILVFFVVFTGLDLISSAIRSGGAGIHMGGAAAWALMVVAMIQCLCRGY